jgi:hypothetical protein
MSKEPDGHELLVSEERVSVHYSSVDNKSPTKYRRFDRQTGRCELVGFPSQENSTNSAICLSFLLLIRINSVFIGKVMAMQRVGYFPEGLRASGISTGLKEVERTK